MRCVIVVVLLTVACGAAPGADSARRQTRSGGFPKFPSLVQPAALQPQAAPRHVCGTRGVAFSPPRSNVAAAKIVGGAASPYGAYPWQVCAFLFYFFI